MKTKTKIYFPELRFNSCDFLKSSAFEIVVPLFLSFSQIFSLSGVRKGFLPSSKRLSDLIFAMIKYNKCLIIPSAKTEINHFILLFNAFRISFLSEIIASRRTKRPIWSKVTATSNPRHFLVNPINLYNGKLNPEYSKQMEYSHSTTSSRHLVVLIPDFCSLARLSWERSYSNLYSILKKINPRRKFPLGGFNIPRGSINSTMSINYHFSIPEKSNL